MGNPSDSDLVAKIKALRQADVEDVDWSTRLEAADRVRLVVAESRGEFLKWCKRMNRQPGVDAVFVSHDGAGYAQVFRKDPTKYELVLIGTIVKTINQEILEAAKRLGMMVRNG